MSLHFILVGGTFGPGVKLGANGRMTCGRRMYVQVPDVLAHHHSPPSWSAWTSHLLEHVTRGHEPIVVGHSSASAPVADLATKLPARGIIIVDGDVPPSRGAAVRSGPPFTTSSRALSNPTACFRSGPDGLRAIRGGMSLVGLDILARDAVALAGIEQRTSADAERSTTRSICRLGYIPLVIQTSRC